MHLITIYIFEFFIIQIPLQTEIAIVALQKDGRGNYEDVGQRYPANQNAIQYNSANREYKIEDHVRGDAPLDVYYYWSLPPEFLGNQVNIYTFILSCCFYLFAVFKCSKYVFLFGRYIQKVYSLAF